MELGIHKNPRFLLAPAPFCTGHGHRHEWVIRCGWGAVFARVWKGFFRNEMWMQELNNEYLRYMDYAPRGLTDIKVVLNEVGIGIVIYPGEEAWVSVDSELPGIYRFSSHNMHRWNQIQACQHLISVWFGRVSDKMYDTDTIEEDHNYTKGGFRSSCSEDKVQWTYSIADRTPSSSLYRVEIEGVRGGNYYVHESSEASARERVWLILGGQDGLFGSRYNWKVEEIPFDRYYQLPVFTEPNF